MKRNIAVIFGGKSVEHEVSVVSALQAISNLNKDKYNIVPLYITKDGKWYSGNTLLNIENYKNIPKLLKEADKIYLSSNADEFKLYYTDKKIKSPLSFNPNRKYIEIDILFPLIHGTNGEDGILQGAIETANIPYVGSNVVASAVGMDKVMMKHIFKSVGLSTIDFVWFLYDEWIENPDRIIGKIKNFIDFPCIVKPAIAGSSIGIKKASNIKELNQAIEFASKFCPKTLVEKYIFDMMEINCSVIGTSLKQKASICERPIGASEILDYENKYISDSRTKSTKGGMQSMGRIIPADISDKLTKQIQEMAKLSFRELNCSGVARIDFMIDKSINQVYINELNGIPGSLSFYLWEKSGLNYPALLDKLIDIAIDNYRIKQETTYSYESNLLNLQSSGNKTGIKIQR